MIDIEKAMIDLLPIYLVDQKETTQPVEDIVIDSFFVTSNDYLRFIELDKSGRVIAKYLISASKVLMFGLALNARAVELLIKKAGA